MAKKRTYKDFQNRLNTELENRRNPPIVNPQTTQPIQKLLGIKQKRMGQ